MTELQKALLTSGVTIIGGVTIFLLSKIIEGFVIAPLVAQGRAFGEIAGTLYYLGEIYGNPFRSALNPYDEAEATRYKEAKRTIRKAASDLIEASGSVSCYRLLRIMRLTPKRESVREIVGLLTGISNNLFERELGRGGIENSDAADRILILMNWPRLSK
jgi:hypothetical protein